VLSEIDNFVATNIQKLNGIVNLSTGKIELPYKFKNRLYDITINKRSDDLLYYIVIEGSLHLNYFKGQDYNTLNYIEMHDEIFNICEDFLLDPKFLLIQSLTIGINVKTTFKPNEFLSKNLLFYKLKRLEAIQKDEEYNKNSYCLKGVPQVVLYDKGVQYSLPYNILRFELRYMNTIPLCRIGVICLSDLLNTNNLKLLSGILENAWEHVSIYESILTLNEAKENRQVHQEVLNSISSELELGTNWNGIL
jgi:hypothetical protein